MTDFVELKRLSTGKSAILQKFWARRITQNDCVLGSSNLKYFGRKQTDNLDEKGKSSEEIQMAL
jgi:hypothetical protein